jgi:hypothetical protein
MYSPSRQLARVIAIVTVGLGARAVAQPSMHGASGPTSGAGMQMPTPLGIPESRDASGTSWQPDSTPMFMWHAMFSGWELSLHENAFFGYDNARTERGDDQWLSINWIMGMARHRLGDGDLTLRAMFSLEPATLPGDGYPLLLQSGESWQGAPLHDRQHPHDYFMEIAARIREPVSDDVAMELYVAPSGEPAIGPTAYPHRFTAMADPLAPLGHHWEDSTHISFGVLTAGVFTRTLKLEGSWFNGREPDEDRWDFDLRTPDSYAARLSVNPSPDFSAQASWARLDSPEALEPATSVQRVTASLTWNRSIPEDVADVSVLALYGRNMPSDEPATDAGLVEGALMHDHQHTVFTRAELLTKTGRDLVLPETLADDTFGMASLSLGFVQDFPQLGTIVPGVGIVGTLDVIGSNLEPFYGTRTPWGGMVFVRLRPPEMEMGGHAMKM